MRTQGRAPALLLAALAACSAADPRPGPAGDLPQMQVQAAQVRFLALGDWGSGRPGQRTIARAMEARTALEPVDFIITVGDNIYPNGVRSAHDSQWQTKFEQVYTAPSLQVPWRPTLGNHDYHWNPDGEVEYSAVSDRWQMPARHYTYSVSAADGTVVQFFALDTQMLQSPNEEQWRPQMEWLERELGESTAEWKIAYGHHPVHSSGRHGDGARMIERAHPLFERLGLDLYVAGHDHTLELFQPVDGVTYAIAGGGGGADMAYRIQPGERTAYGATGGGFVLATVTADEVRLEFTDADGATRFEHSLRH